MHHVDTVHALFARPRVLITYGSRHGATREIAAALARELAVGRGADEVAVTLAPVQQGLDPADFDVVVLGSAVYDGRWLPDASDHAVRTADRLRAGPTWLFSSGVVAGGGPPAAVPEAERIAADIGALSHVVFSGRIERRLLSRAERQSPTAAALPDGDHRDWRSVRAWAREIATHCCRPATSALARAGA